MILITGATGQLSRLVINHLLESLPPQRIVAAVRDPAKAADLRAQGIDVRQADYDKPDQWISALEGVEKVLLISAPEVGLRTRQHQHVVEAAKQAGSVSFIAYTSVLRADTAALPYASEDRFTEGLIKATGIPCTFLRHGWYTENYTMNAAAAVQQGALYGCARNGRISGAARADYAAAAAAVLAADRAEKIYELAGDSSFTLDEVAFEISRQSGKSVKYVDMPEDEYRALLIQYGLSANLANTLALADTAAAEGEVHDESRALSQLIHRPTTPLADTVRDSLKA